MWNRIRIACACGFALHCLLHNAQALDRIAPDIETYGRASPLIITAKEQGQIRYEIIDEYRFYRYRTYKVISVEKNIISDYNIPDSGLIETVFLHSPDAFGENTAEWVIKRQKIDQAESEKYYKKDNQDSMLLCLTLSEKGNLEITRGHRLVEEGKKEAMRSAGLFKPIGIDGLETEYSLAEWQKIANAGVDRGYYQLNFVDARPEGWPETLEEAVNTAIEIIEEGGQLPIIDIKPFHDNILRHIGLATQPRERLINEWHVNKTLLLNMGRMSPRKAKPKILDAVMSRLNEKYPVGFKDEWSSITIEQFNFKGKPLGECLDYLIQKVGEPRAYKIVIEPELAGRKANISLRNLSAFHCLQFVTQQVGCTVVAELPISDEVVLHIIDAK